MVSPGAGGSRSVCQHRYGCSCFAAEAGAHGGAARPPARSGAPTISSPREEARDSGGTGGAGGGGGLLRNGKKASSFPGPRPNFLQKSCTLQTSGLFAARGGCRRVSRLPQKQLPKGQRPRVRPAGTRRAACTQADTPSHFHRLRPPATPRGSPGPEGHAKGLLRLLGGKAAPCPKGRWGSLAGHELWGCTGVQEPPTGVSMGH